MNINTQAFLALVRAGLWEEDVELRNCGTTDFSEILQLATEQSVVGLVAAGLEQVKDTKIPQAVALTFAGSTLQIEQRNKAMNLFIAELVGKMRAADIYTLLVKGQGIAQCYERPLWRASGDIDLLLSEENYIKAKEYLLPIATASKAEGAYSKHLGMTIGDWYVELHGTLRSVLSTRMDKEIDDAQREVFYEGKVRSVDFKSSSGSKVQVFLPGADSDVFFVFTHFVRHFYKEGVGLRQICDWIRLMWERKDSLNHNALEKRIKRAGLVSEWKAFAAMAVEYLGMPVEAIPFFNENDYQNEKKKAERLVRIILRGFSGKKLKDTMMVASVFPLNTIKFLPGILFNVNMMKLREKLIRI